MAIHKASSALPPPAKNNVVHIFPWRRRQHRRALGSEPYNPIMCPPHRKHLPHLLGFQSSITKTCPNIFIFSLRHYTMQHACFFQFLSHDLHCGVAHTHTHTHTHRVPDVCRKLNQTLRLNHPPPMSPSFILLYPIYPSIRSTLPHRLTSRSTWSTNTQALSSSSSQLIINSLKTKT